MRDRLEELEREFGEIEARLGDPEIIADRKRYTAETRRYKQLEAIVATGRELRTADEELIAGDELWAESTGPERDEVREMIDDARLHRTELEAQLRLQLLPRDPNDDKNVIIEIRGAEGGEEANLFARDLYTMYQGYAAQHGWKFETLEARESPMGGFTEVIVLLSGDAIWSRMKHEGGPHRVQRVPVTEAQGRVHTSSATVSVLPEAEDVDVDVDPNDLDIDVFRSSGPGGQSVNTTDSAVRITHRPTGLVVSMQDEKSQIQNRAKALRVLRSRLLALEQERQASEVSDARRSQIGGGGRSEKIRTYNYKENRVSDHRIGLTLYQLDKILAGALDGVVEPLIQHEQAELLTGDEADTRRTER